jgi:glycosyltransferase involved in cell wall biosynthesis
MMTPSVIGQNFSPEKGLSSSGTDRAAIESKDRPAVSVIIPTYNSASFLRETIESVLGQTYSDFEVIVVDDGSTDETERVMRSFGARVSYVKQENRGVSAARNHGIKLARARYVAFLDSDDLWVPQKLAEQIPLLDEDPEIGLVYSDWAVVSKRGATEPSFHTSRPAASGHVFNELVQTGFILTSGTVVRRSCLDDVGDFDESLSVAEDYDLWLRISYRWKVAVVNKALVIKRSWDGSLSTNFPKTALGRITLFQKALRDNPDMTARSRQLVRRQLASSYWDVGYDYFDRLLLKEARKNLISSLALDWRNGRALGCLAASCLPSHVVKVVRAVRRAIL